MFLSRFSSKCESEIEDRVKDMDCGNWGQKPSLLYVHIKNISFKVEVKINSFLAILPMI